MLKHYSHIRMEAKRRALESIVSKPELKQAQTAVAGPDKPQPTADGDALVN